MILSGQAYRCSAGETFDRVALAIYGDEKYARELLNANPLLCITPFFKGGELLQLPVVEIPDTEDSSVYTPASAPWKE